MKKIRFFALTLVFILLPTDLIYADVVSDQITTAIPFTGKAKQTRIIIINNNRNFNYSIPPNAKTKDFHSILQPCKDSKDLECIESFEYRSINSQVWNSAVISKRNIPEMYGAVAINHSISRSAGLEIKVETFTQLYGEIDRDEKNLLPRGGASSFWDLPKAVHTGGSEYQLNVAINNIRNFNDSSVKYPLNLVANIHPIAWKSTIDNNFYDKLSGQLVYFNFPENFEYRIVLRLGFLESEISNWYNGRIDRPEIKIDKGKVSLSGRPTWVPVAGTPFYGCDELSPQRLGLMNFLSFQRFDSLCNDPVGSAYSLSEKNPLAFDAFAEWENEITEYGKNSAWNIESVISLGKCQEPGINGFVSSNALLYTPGPPMYDQVSKSLTYKIASTHLDSKRSLNRGRFSLAIKSSVAQCLWEMSPSNFNSAGIQVTYEDGRPIVGTQSVFTRNEWTYIFIEDFTFSTQIFRILPATSKGDNPSSQTQKEQPQPLKSQKMPLKKSVVLCVKGKLIKKLTGINPKCPAGYKKK